MGKTIACKLTPDELTTIIDALDTEIEMRRYEANHCMDDEDSACHEAAMTKVTALQDRLRTLAHI